VKFLTVCFVIFAVHLSAEPSDEVSYLIPLTQATPGRCQRVDTSDSPIPLGPAAKKMPASSEAGRIKSSKTSAC